MSKPKSNVVDVAEGSYTAVIKTIADIGTQTVKPFEGEDGDEEEKKQYIVVVELVEESRKDKIVSLNRWLNASLSKKATLYKMMKAAGINNPASTDLDECLGRGVQITVEHSSSGRAKITEFIPLRKGEKYAKGFMKESSVYLDDSYDKEAFKSMPEFIQNAIIKSPEFEDVDGGKKIDGGKKKKSKDAKGKGKG